MKAVVLASPGEVILQELSSPKPGVDEMLIRTGAATICTSDLHDIRYNPFNIQLPVTLGHEGAGTVVQLGSEVRGFQVGDRVATHPVHPCGRCRLCQQGLGHLCLEMGHFGINMPGTFAEYYLVRQDRARLLPDQVDFAVAALVEPVSVCLEALAQARLSPGQNLLILGDGPFGILMSRLASRLPLTEVVIAGFFDSRLAYARGARRINTSQLSEPVQALCAPLAGEGYDSVILAVSSAKAFADGMNCLRPRGRMVVFSALPGETPVDLLWLHLKELEVVGACSDQDRYDEAVQLLPDPDLALDELITQRFLLSSYLQALEQAETGKDQTMKVAIQFTPAQTTRERKT